MFLTVNSKIIFSLRYWSKCMRADFNLPIHASTDRNAAMNLLESECETDMER